MNQNPTVGHNAQPKMTARDVNVFYGQKQAIKGVSIDVSAEHVTVFIGPSGCGKSTFIRCINRMHEVVPGARAAGEVLLNGEDLYARAVDPVDLRRRVGMVFQRPNPFPTMSIYENVAAGLRLNGLAGKKRGGDLDDLVEECLTRAALWDEVKGKLRQSALGLSGGQQQRLCIARAIAIKPDVILMDEPCSALDPIATIRIEELMTELKSDYTIVIVTHNMQQAARVSDRTAFFTVDLSEGGRTGVMVEMGPTEQIFTAPSDQRTDDYITGRFG